MSHIHANFHVVARTDGSRSPVGPVDATAHGRRPRCYCPVARRPPAPGVSGLLPTTIQTMRSPLMNVNVVRRTSGQTAAESIDGKWKGLWY